MKKSYIMDDLEKLKITYETGPYGQKVARLNMPVKELYDTLGATGWDVFEKLEERGMKIEGPIMASPEDIKDYKNIQCIVTESSEHEPSRLSDAEIAERERTAGLENVLSNLVYYDTEFTDPSTGKCGLKDSNGNVVVPALFDRVTGVDCVWSADNYVPVAMSGKHYFTPRDGSGNIMDIGPFDRICMTDVFAWVEHDGKQGVLSSSSLDVIVPCEMDWIAVNHAGFDKLFGRADKIGMYDGYLEKYVDPIYSAFDYTTLRFCRDGKWGWIRRDNLEFTEEVPASHYDIMLPGLDTESYLRYEDKPKPPGGKEYYTSEEVFGGLEKKVAAFKRKLGRPFSERLQLKPLRFPKGTITPPYIYDALQALCRKRGEGKMSIVAKENADAPEMRISLKTAEGKDKIHVEWQPRTNALAWQDALSPMTSCFHQLIESRKDTFGLRFTRDFSVRQLSTVAKFVAYYYEKVWDVRTSESGSLVFTAS